MCLCGLGGVLLLLVFVMLFVFVLYVFCFLDFFCGCEDFGRDRVYVDTTVD